MSDRGIPLDPKCPRCEKPHGVAVSGDGYEHKCAACGGAIICAIGPDGGEMYPNEEPSDDGDDMPTMTCPRCKMEMPDFDGFGVLAHIAPMPNPCGYCTHPSASVVDGVSICGICSRPVEDPKPAPTTPPWRDVHRIIEVTGERGGTHVVHVLECGHWLTRRKASTRMRCIGCVIEGKINEHSLKVEDAALFVMGALRAAERGMQNDDRAKLEEILRAQLDQMRIDRVDAMIARRKGEQRGDEERPADEPSTDHRGDRTGD